jgi:hypothetical protein
VAQDEEYLRLLSIFHYVVVGIAALFGSLPIAHLIGGLLLVFGVVDDNGKPPPPFFGWMFVIVGAVGVTVGWTLAGLILAAGVCLARRRHYMFCLVTAGFECLCQPFGLVLGIFTIIVLTRDSVKRLFEANKSPVATASLTRKSIV